MRLINDAYCIAEESGKSGKEDAALCWVIDPLDGTHNFSRGLSYFAVNIALTYYDSPILAVTYLPALKETFWALKEGGAWLNGNRICTSEIQTLSGALCTYDTSIIGFLKHNGTENDFFKKCYATRHIGASAIDLAYIAAGRFDGGLFRSPQWWDVAAGILLINEAQGIMSNEKGHPVVPGFSFCIASNRILYKEVISFLA
jgi:myo-inositol-1(or 4)-monophosphatase